MSFSDVAAVSKLRVKGKGRKSAVQEMFLISEQDDQDTLFSLGSLTKDFINTQVERLDLFATIKARVDHFQSCLSRVPTLAKINRELRRADIAARNGDCDPLTELLWKLNSDKYPPEVLENPPFVAMRGYAATLASPQILLLFAMISNRQWAWDIAHRSTTSSVGSMSKLSQIALTQSTLDIEKAVSADKRYLLSERSEIGLMRAVFLYNYAKTNIFTDPHRALDLLEESLTEHIEAYAGLLRSKSPLASKVRDLRRIRPFSGQRAAKFGQWR